MLYDMIFLIILALMIPIVAFIAFLAGYNTGRAVRLDEHIKTLPTFSFSPKPRQREETEDERKQRILMENIDNYGTKKPQREVK